VCARFATSVSAFTSGTFTRCSVRNHVCNSLFLRSDHWFRHRLTARRGMRRCVSSDRGTRLIPDLGHLNPSGRGLRSCAARRRGSLPGLTPIPKALTLAFELLATFSHSSAALRAHTIQNAGDHICARPNRVESHELHMHLTNDNCFGSL
jgi:hypothetical protein